jgi:hypothetical protein
VREHHSAAEARDNIRQELAANLGRMQLRADAETCQIRRLKEVQDLLDRAGHGEALPQPIWIGTPDVWEMNTSRLDVASQSGRASLLSANEQAVIARVYSHMRVFADISAREQPAWATLRTLEHTSRLDPSLRTALTLALQEARFDRFRIAVASSQAIRQAAEIGIKPNVALSQRFAHREVCLPLNATAEDARRARVAAGLQDLNVAGPNE